MISERDIALNQCPAKREEFRRYNASEARFLALGLSNEGAGLAVLAKERHAKRLKIAKRERRTQKTESASTAVTIEALSKRISAWHASETALRRQLSALPEGAPGRDRIETDADHLAEQIIRAEDRISEMPADTPVRAYLKLILCSWRADLEEEEDRALIKRVLRDIARYLEPKAGITAEMFGLGDWIDCE